jgi:hypothetical protein
MLEKIVYTIRDKSAIFQLAIHCTILTLWRSRVYHVLLVEKSGTFITYSVIYYFLSCNKYFKTQKFKLRLSFQKKHFNILTE